MNEQLNQPAFPPMVAQDSLGRVIIMSPGMSKLEWYINWLQVFNGTVKNRLGGLPTSFKLIFLP